MPTLDEYLNEIPDYNAKQPNFMATLSALVAPVANLQTFLAGLPQAFDLDTAIGVQLDQVGIWIGRNRQVQAPITGVYFSWDTDNLGWEQGFWQGAFDPDDGVQSLDDNTYRALLYAKAATNVWDGSSDAIVQILNKLLAPEGATATVIDNQDMTMQVQVNPGLSNLIFQAILNGGYLPIKPEGVHITYVIPTVTGQSVTASATIIGQGSVTATATQKQTASALISGAGAVTGTATGGTGVGSQTASAIILGTGAVAASTPVIVVHPTPSPIGGQGSVTANATTLKHASATILGAGLVTADSQVSKPFFANVGGQGSVVASATALHPLSLRIGGSGSVTADAIVKQGSTQTFDPTHNNTENTLSSGNLIATKSTGNGVYSITTAAKFVTGGRYYWENLIGAKTGDTGLGIANKSVSLANNAFLGTDGNSYGLYANRDQWNSTVQNSGIFADPFSTDFATDFGAAIFQAGDNVGFALDASAGILWWRVNGGTWQPSGDPAIGTGGWAIPVQLQALTAGGVAPAIVLFNTSDSVTGKFSAVSWTYAAPTGFGVM